MALSSARRVGLSLRPYSKPPRVSPTASCLKVVLISIAGETPPVSGSGSAPAWTASVSNWSVIEQSLSQPAGATPFDESLLVLRIGASIRQRQLMRRIREDDH